MATPSSDTLCVLCNEDISGDPEEEIVTLGKKGSATVNQNSEERGSECVLRKDNVSTTNAEKNGALNTASRLQKAKNRSTLHLHASYDLKTRNLKSAKIVFLLSTSSV